MTEKDKAALKPCPFCKSEPELIRRVNDFTTRQTAIIKCTKPGCTCEMRVGVIRQSYQWAVDRVIEKWNTRSALVPAAGVGMQKLVSRLQKHADEMAAENGSVEPDTNAWVPSNDWIETYLEGVDKCLEIVKAAAPEPEKAQGDDVMTDKELRDWIFQWSQNEGKIPLESDINDLIWTIQKYAPPAVSPADAGVESAGELAEKIYEWCACLTRDDAENQIRGLLGRLSSRASLPAGQGVAWQPIETVPKQGHFDVWAKRWNPNTDTFTHSRFTDCYWRERDEFGQWKEGIKGLDDGWVATHWMPLPASLATKSKPSEGE